MGLKTAVAVLASQALPERPPRRGRLLWGRPRGAPSSRPAGAASCLQMQNRVVSPFLHEPPPSHHGLQEKREKPTILSVGLCPPLGLPDIVRELFLTCLRHSMPQMCFNSLTRFILTFKRIHQEKKVLFILYRLGKPRRRSSGVTPGVW